MIEWLKGRAAALLLLGVALQLAVLTGMIALRMRLLATGETVLLRIVPVDPRDIFRGDYVTLSYDFSRVQPSGIPGLGTRTYGEEDQWLGRTVYVALLPEDDGQHWRGGNVTLQPPSEGKYIRGKINSSQGIECGIEAYYVQEGEGMKYEQAARNRQLSAEVALTPDGQAALKSLHIDGEPNAHVDKTPGYSSPSDTTYRVRYVPDAKIELTGRADSPEWAKANVEKQFFFPWKKDAVAPATEFRALCDQKYLYFTFQVEDADIVVLDTLSDKQDIVLEDRVEMFLSKDWSMHDYLCFEIDSRGRTYDYRGKFYRKFDPSWSCPGLETKATQTANGYAVEGRIPLARLEAEGFPRLRPGSNILCGLYRAEFSHDRSGKSVVQTESIHTQGRKMDGPAPIEEWMSWVDPKTKEPDFHVPGSLGHLEIVE